MPTATGDRLRSRHLPPSREDPFDIGPPSRSNRSSVSDLTADSLCLCGRKMVFVAVANVHAGHVFVLGSDSASLQLDGQ